MDSSQRRDLGELILKSLSGIASDRQRQQLGEIVSNDPQAMEYYMDYINLYACLTSPGSSSNSSQQLESYDDSNDSAIMQAMLALAECEMTAPGVVIEEPVTNKPLLPMIDKSTIPSPRGPGPGKFQLFITLTMAACLMFMFAYVYFAPKADPLPVVAELVDQVNTVWDQEMQLPDDGGLMRQSIYRLKEGLVSILFKGGAKITIEAPAEWSLLGGGNMELFQGRIYAVVPKEAHGFTVMAGNSKIVDLGTEFGIEVDKSNNTQLHVTRGETLLFSGAKTGNKSQIKVNEGTAKKVNSDGIVKDIGIGSRHFVSDIRMPYMNISVPNASFETLALNHKEWGRTKNVTLWSTPPWTTQYKKVGTNNWTLDQSPNGGAVTPNAAYGYGGIAPKGKSLGYVSTDPKSDHCLYQQIAFPLQSLRTYELSVKVGSPSTYNNAASVAYRVELLAGGVVIASDSGVSPADDLKWITAGISYTSGPDKAADLNVGQPLAIRLIAEAFTENKHINFDDVRLLVKAGTGND
ncbi:MAG: hypothetical protein K9M75_01905 [Phycisphaerae bacterium]|nr:hypothetical protein [Phycisphaerae bacterium]